MTPLPPPLGDGALVLWRLDQARHAAAWDSGEGAYRVGGRWNSPGVRAVYASLDPSTAILEVAVHKTFRALDTTAHMLTFANIREPARIQVIDADEIPNPNWLRPGMPSAGQQAFGDALLATHRVVLLPSVVSVHSWNLIFTAGAELYDLVRQEPFALDTRLHPPTANPP